MSGQTPVASPIAQTPSVDAHPLVDRDPLSRWLHADGVEADVIDARSAAGRHEQALRAQVVAPRELDDVLVTIAADGAGVLAEVELDPVCRERGAQRVAQRLRFAR